MQTSTLLLIASLGAISVLLMLYILRQNRIIFFLSLISYFYANLLISQGTLIFLKTKVKNSLFLSIGLVWLLFFIFFSARNWPDLQMIKYTYLYVFALSAWVGTVMIRSAKRYGKLALFLGLLNIAWVANTVIFSYILEIPQIASYIVSQDIVLKESQLNESEWSIMKKHVEIGYRLAQISGEFALLAGVILYHHEWWNGQAILTI